MRILSFTGGAGQMYCGSCLRDNALASALIARGHDVVLTPVYTPTRTDERNVSQHHVVFGGISVFLEQHSSLFRHTPRLLDRLWDAEWVIKLASKRQIKVDPAEPRRDDGVDAARRRRASRRKEIAKLLDWLKTEQRVRRHQPALHAAASGSPNRSSGRSARPSAARCRARTCSSTGSASRGSSSRWIYSRRQRARRRVPARQPLLLRLHAWLPRHPARRRCGWSRSASTSTATRLRPPRGSRAVHDRLLRAHRAGERACTCSPTRIADCARGRHRPFAPGRGRLPRARAPGLPRRHHARPDDVGASGDQFEYRGELDRMQKIDFLRSLDVLSVPATYEEPKGIFLLEAMASGVPVVQPRRGAFPEIVRPTGGGLHRRGGQSRGAGRRLPGALAGSGARRRTRRRRCGGCAAALQRRPHGRVGGGGLPRADDQLAAAHPTNEGSRAQR